MPKYSQQREINLKYYVLYSVFYNLQWYLSYNHCPCGIFNSSAMKSNALETSNTMVYIITVLVEYPTLWKACWFGRHTWVQSLLMEWCDQVPLINTTQIVLIKISTSLCVNKLWTLLSLQCGYLYLSTFELFVPPTHPSPPAHNTQQWENYNKTIDCSVNAL